MFDRDKWQEIFETIRKNKWRTLATAFGVFWGILMLVLLMGAGQGLQNGVVSNMILDATNSIWFFTDRTSLPYKGLPPGRTVEFKESDLNYIKDNVEGLEYIAAENWLMGNFNIIHGQKSSPFQVMGTGKDYFSIKIYQEYLAGRKLNFNDNLEARKVCVIGDRVSNVLFEPGESPIGKEIQIKGSVFTVVGLFHDEGWGGQFSERIYIPFSTFQRTYNPERTVRLFAVTTKAGYSGKVLEQNILTVLKQRHMVHPDDNQAFWTHNQEENYRSVMGLFFGIKSFVWLVGIGTLIAGIVGVSNIMIIVVRDRTREIGIRKALGATPWSIVSMIITEAILITSVAGYFGLLAGVGLLSGLNRIMSIAGAESEYFTNPSVNLSVAFSAMLLLVAAGALAGLVPARRAARITPVEALRYTG
ncbi:MAG: ABC transporter permease [Phaeodactylibacter sp.]|nr:ABC transporter permease [Phaeodactylibacter sp.]MCB9303129.1 ABC transporter permease [Lewinellaceae bacterium]